MKRRDAICALSLTGAASVLGSKEALAEALAPKTAPTYNQAMKGLPPLKITNIKTILPAPNRIRLVVVKVETSEPGLVGWGCATFTQRALVVKTAIDEYLAPFLKGCNVDEIEARPHGMAPATLRRLRTPRNWRLSWQVIIWSPRRLRFSERNAGSLCGLPRSQRRLYAGE